MLGIGSVVLYLYGMVCTVQYYFTKIDEATADPGRS